MSCNKTVHNWDIHMSKLEKTRKAILNAAIAILSRRPDASLSDIADHAGVGRATLHRHFESRDDLIRSLALEAIRETDEVCQPVIESAGTAEHMLSGIFEAIIPLGDRYNFLSNYRNVENDQEVRKQTERQVAETLELVKALKAENAIAADIPDAWVVAVIDALIYAAWDGVEDGHIARRDAAGLAMRTIMTGLGKA